MTILISDQLVVRVKSAREVGHWTVRRRWRYSVRIKDGWWTG